MEQFQEGVTEIMMACEELRQPFKDKTKKVIAADVLLTGREDLDFLFQNLGGMHQQLHQNNGAAAPSSPSPSTDANQYQQQQQQEDEEILKIKQDLFQHCQSRVAQVAQLLLERALESPEPCEDDYAKKHQNASSSAVGLEDDNDEEEQQERQQQMEDDRRDCQASIARIIEVNFILSLETGDHQRIEPMIQDYVSFQRNALRERAKPSIARLAQERHTYDNDGNNHDTLAIVERIPHSHVITVILGQASALIHPLLAWMFSLPPPLDNGQEEDNKLVAAIRKLCGESLLILDEQAQALTKTVSDWFWTDRKVDDWMAKSNNAHDQGFDGRDDNSQDNDTEENHKLYLGELDSLVEDMAFVCQVLARYQDMIQDLPLNLQKTIEQELSPEWTWKYASLERFLAMQQWKSALLLATPVHIVLGTSIQVPSVVEDAQYLSTRALERSASTRSTQAIGTVAHSISSHVWSTDMTGGVHQALVDQIGCHVDEASLQEQQQQQQQAPVPPKNANSFASALLDALDDEPPAQAPKKKPPRPPVSGGPSSGGIFQSLVGGGDGLQQLRINTDFCQLNGIHSASAACRSLVKFLDGLLENPAATGAHEDGSSDKQMNAMIQLAREDLSHCGNAYEMMLKSQAQHVIAQWCGSLHDPPKRKNSPCIPLLRNYFLNEVYELDQSAFKQAESDTRLEQELLGCLQESKFIQQSNNKCDADVLLRIGEELTVIVKDLVLDCLWHADPPKRFTDWGSLLLSKQVRMMQSFLSKLQEPASSSASSDSTKARIDLFKAWERLSQVVTVLQLERPSDWMLYQSTSVLTGEELRMTMQLRVDFSADAINTIVASIAANSD